MDNNREIDGQDETKMRTSHRILLRLYHDDRFDFRDVEIDYIDRGAPRDRSTVSGEKIATLDRDYFEIESPYGPTPIPYHRITEIRYRGVTAWDRILGDQIS